MDMTARTAVTWRATRGDGSKPGGGAAGFSGSGARAQVRPEGGTRARPKDVTALDLLNQPVACPDRRPDARSPAKIG
jgi:hypothetical protein